MHILITGGSGLIGRYLVASWLARGDSVTVLTRDSVRAQRILGTQVNYLTSVPTPSSVNQLHDIDAVVNLAGEPIADKRWSHTQKEKLCQSRWQITEQVVSWINASENKPQVLISGSAVGYYGNQGSSVVTEDEIPLAGFTHDLCTRWEAIAQQAHTRVCLLRTGIVLAVDGGALSKMLPAFRLGLGGPIGNGHQYLPWIHIADMVNAINFLLDHQTLNGPFNLTAPYPVHNEQFAHYLASVLHRPAFLRIPAALLQLLLGETAELLLGGQRAIPQRLEQAGFHFKFIELHEALTDLLSPSSTQSQQK